MKESELPKNLPSQAELLQRLKEAQSRFENTFNLKTGQKFKVEFSNKKNR